jgi:hypothetical protein
MMAMTVIKYVVDIWASHKPSRTDTTYNDNVKTQSSLTHKKVFLFSSSSHLLNLTRKKVIETVSSSVCLCLSLQKTVVTRDPDALGMANQMTFSTN